jgi:hypothetical protein
MNKYETLVQIIIWAEGEFGGSLPHVVLACAGAADEHWQIWDSDELYRAARSGDEVFPVFVIDPETMETHPHPDGTAARKEM